MSIVYGRGSLSTVAAIRRWNNGSMNDGRSRRNEQGTDVPVTE